MAYGQVETHSRQEKADRAAAATAVVADGQNKEWVAVSIQLTPGHVSYTRFCA
jgi:hypothetical protein